MVVADQPTAEQATSPDDSDTESDCSSSDEKPHTGANCLWRTPRSTCKPLPLHALKKPKRPSNRFTAIANDDDHCHNNVVEACQAITSKISTGPKQSQKQRRQKKHDTIRAAPGSDEEVLLRALGGKSALRNPKVLAAAKRIIAAEKDDGGSWHVVDSGAVDNVSDVRKEFPKHKVVLSKAQAQGLSYQAAGGAEIKNEGQTVIHSHDANGTKMPPLVLQVAKVGINILSVRKLTKAGCKCEFRDDGGTITLPTGEEVPFKIRQGIYMVKLYVLPPDGSDMPGFTRLGS